MRILIALISVLISIQAFAATRTVNVSAIKTQVVSPTGNVTVRISPSDNRIFSDPNVLTIEFDGDKYVVGYK